MISPEKSIIIDRYNTIKYNIRIQYIFVAIGGLFMKERKLFIAVIFLFTGILFFSLSLFKPMEEREIKITFTTEE